MSGSVRFRTAAPTLAALSGLVLLTACASGQNYDTHTTSPSGIGLGTGAGAAAGALAGRAIAGKHDNTLAMVGGALLGGIAGNVAVDRPNQLRGQDETAAAANADQQRQLDFQHQSQLQQAQTQQQIEDQKEFEQWKAQRGAGTQVAAVTTQADITQAQRLLTGLGYYRGPIDGVYGAGTRSAIMQFESSQGLPRTGYLTPSLVQSMRAAI
ncbi:MAG: peptidoglycan-binding domain-containing protein [Geminicoccaceae bacterium]